MLYLLSITMEMSAVKENFALLSYNTFQVAANARFFIELTDTASVNDFLASDLPRAHPHFVLGGGSNVLFTKDFEGIIIHPVIKGIEKTGEDNDTCYYQGRSRRRMGRFC